MHVSIHLSLSFLILSQCTPPFLSPTDASQLPLNRRRLPSGHLHFVPLLFPRPPSLTLPSPHIAVVWAACGHGVELWIGAACNHDGVTVRTGDMRGADWHTMAAASSGTNQSRGVWWRRQAEARDGVVERGTRRSSSRGSTHRHLVHHLFGFQGFKISLFILNVSISVRKTKHKPITKLTT